MTLDVRLFPCLTDNYGLLVRDRDSGRVATIDTPDADAILAELERSGWGRLDLILNTHWHPDHVGGNADIVAATGAKVTGPQAEAAKIPHISRAVVEGDTVQIGSNIGRVIDCPAHTAGHNAYAFEGALFCGDTLFAMGCGRLFEGTAEQMHAALAKFMALPPRTLVYCAHEYTQSNARFALTVEPENDALVRRAEAVDRLRERGDPTVPFSLAMEAATNPFVRAGSVAELARRRAAKDAFRG
jgi:hydroxyacylglutathione hydrolase